MSPIFWPFWRQKHPPHHQAAVPLQRLAHQQHQHQLDHTTAGRVVAFPARSSYHPKDLENTSAHQASSHAPAPSPVAATALDLGISSAPEHRSHGSANLILSTTPNPPEQSLAGQNPKSLWTSPSSQLPEYPAVPLDFAAGRTATASLAENQEYHQSTPRRNINSSLAQSPFRGFSKANQAAANRRGLSSVARLWNPTNSTPRIPQKRHRKQPPPTPPLPAIPLRHPALRDLAEAYEPAVASGGSYPLLTLSEKRQSRLSASGRASFQVESTVTSDRRISLPHSIRISRDRPQSLRRRSTALEATVATIGNDSREDQHYVVEPSAKSKGKQKAIMARPSEEAGRPFPIDLERGPGVMAPRLSNVSAADGIGPAPSSSNSSIMGEDVQPDAGGEWGPQHPCYPHLNPHVPVDSLEYITTRIIRVKRDWLVAGDLAPTFSNLYPEILDPAGVSEQEFRRVIDKLNGELISLFDPFAFRNMLDSVLGLVTGWLWNDFGLTAAKSRLNNLEKWIERWNLEMEKTMASEEGAAPPKIIALRQTGYMNLDIQISDPEIAPVPSSIEAGESRITLPMEPTPAITT